MYYWFPFNIYHRNRTREVARPSSACFGFVPRTCVVTQDRLKQWLEMKVTNFYSNPSKSYNISEINSILRHILWVVWTGKEGIEHRLGDSRSGSARNATERRTRGLKAITNNPCFGYQLHAGVISSNMCCVFELRNSCGCLDLKHDVWTVHVRRAGQVAVWVMWHKNAWILKIPCSPCHSRLIFRRFGCNGGVCLRFQWN